MRFRCSTTNLKELGISKQTFYREFTTISCSTIDLHTIIGNFLSKRGSKKLCSIRTNAIIGASIYISCLLINQTAHCLKDGVVFTNEALNLTKPIDWLTKSLALYTTAILQANLDKPPVPKPEWREVMDKLSDLSCAAYRAVVRENPDFVAYFRQATPELELGNLPLGSRPARRKTGGGIESLRAIPWIFAWSQNRLMLPAWLGAGDALQQVMDSQGKTMLEQMCEDWPFFATRISMLEMVYVKADIDISNFYDSVLVDEDKLPLGNQLRTQLTKDISAVLSIRNEESPMEDTPLQRASIDFRNTYVDPLNLLQAELLHRNREKEDGDLQQAIMVTIAGISAGLRNTG